MPQSGALQFRGKKQAGVSLIELMVALVVGLLVSLGAYQVFMTSFVSFSRLDEVARRQEALRFIVDMMAVDIRSAESVGMVSGTLVADFSGRSNDPYCGSSEELESVSYQFDESVGAVSISTRCDGVSDSFREVLRGVSDFKVSPNGNSYSWTILFALDGFEGGSAEKEFEFVVANRRALVPKFDID